MKLLIIEDHELFRAGLKLMLSGLDDQIEFFQAATMIEAEALLSEHDIDLVLMDFQLSAADGRDSLRRLRHKRPEAVVVVISGEGNPAAIHSLIESGAAGFIPKRSSQAVMIAALKLVMVGGVYLPLCMFPSGFPHPVPSTAHASQRFELLSPRQLQIVRQAILGKPNKVIANDMGIAEATVKAHLSGAYRLLGVRNRTEAVFIAARGLEEV